MANLLPLPASFGLDSFAQLLPPRDPIPGEDPSTFEEFHNIMLLTVAPATPYEAVVAESLIAIEWDILQHRRLGDAVLRQSLRTKITDAVKEKCLSDYLEARDVHDERNVGRRPAERASDVFPEFDERAAQMAGEDLAARAVSRDRSVRLNADCEIEALGMQAVDLLGQAYRSSSSGIHFHREQVAELEVRRRAIKRDYDALQAARPIEAEKIEP